MKLSELLEGVSSPGGVCYIKEWIKDCLGDITTHPGQKAGINDFSGEVVPKLLCLNFLKEIKGNMPGNVAYRKIILLLEDYIKDRADKLPAFRIRDFNRFLGKQDLGLLCAGREIRNKPPGFSTITTLQDIFQYCIPGSSPELFENIDDLNAREKIDYIKSQEASGLPMRPLRTRLPLFWCTRSDDIFMIGDGRENKVEAIRDELGLLNRTSGYLVEFRLSSDYVSDPRQPTLFDSGPNEYFYVAGPGSEYGRTRRLSDFCLTDWTEAVHREKDWPDDKAHDIIPLGLLGDIPTPSEFDKEKALEEMWANLTGSFPGIVEEIRDLYYNKENEPGKKNEKP